MEKRKTQIRAVSCFVAAAIVLVGFCGSPCVADFIPMDWGEVLSDTLTVTLVDTEIVAGGSWGIGTEFYYEVTMPDEDHKTDPLHYKYTFTASSSPNLSHFILEVSGAVEGLAAFTLTDPDYLNGPTTGETLLDDYTSSVGNPNPSGGATWEMFGIKFGDMFGDSEGPWIIEFDSYRLPMEGSFYAKGASDTYAYNTYLTGGDDFILVPDTKYVPIPTAVLLGILGLGAVGLKLRKYA